MTATTGTITDQLDVERARRETPGCAEVIHPNNAGAALMPGAVLERTVAHLRHEGRIGGYEAAAREEAGLECSSPSVTT